MILESQGLLVVVQATQRLVVGGSERCEMKGGLHLIPWASDGVLLLRKIWANNRPSNFSQRVLAVNPAVHEALGPAAVLLFIKIVNFIFLIK